MALTWMMSSILLLFNSWGFFSFARGATTQRLFQAKASLKVETMFVSLYPIRHSRSSILPSGISWLNSPTIPSRCAGSALALTWRMNRFSVIKNKSVTLSFFMERAGFIFHLGLDLTQGCRVSRYVGADSNMGNVIMLEEGT